MTTPNRIPADNPYNEFEEHLNLHSELWQQIANFDCINDPDDEVTIERLRFILTDLTDAIDWYEDFLRRYPNQKIKPSDQVAAEVRPCGNPECLTCEEWEGEE